MPPTARSRARRARRDQLRDEELAPGCPFAAVTRIIRRPRPARRRSRRRGSCAWPRCRRSGRRASSTRSARSPGAMRPRSGSPKCSAATEVAASNASAGVSPASTSSASSSCRLSPNAGDAGAAGVAFASVPARIGMPAAWSAATDARAGSYAGPGMPCAARFSTMPFIIVSVGTITVPLATSSAAWTVVDRAVERCVGEDVDPRTLRHRDGVRARRVRDHLQIACVGRGDQRVHRLLVETGQVDHDLDVVGALLHVTGDPGVDVRRRPPTSASAAAGNVLHPRRVRARRGARGHQRTADVGDPGRSRAAPRRAERANSCPRRS